MKNLLLMCVLTILASSNVLSQDTLRMAVFNNRFLIVEITLNDSIRSQVILDTGGGLELISGRLFSRIRGSAKPNGIFTAFQSIGSRIDLELYQIPSMQIGVNKKQNISVAPYPPLDDATGIDGIISMKLFEHQPFTMDFRSQKLVLESEQSLENIIKQAEIVPLQEHNNQNIALDIFVPVVLNDSIAILAEFDTGTGIEVLINPYFINTLGIDSLSGSITVESFQNPDGRVQRKYIASIPSIGIAGSSHIRQENMSATFLKDFIYEGLIGWQLFRDHKVTIDYPNRRMLIR